MADLESVSLTKILKNSKILVNVEEVLQDILVVSYVSDSKLYQGALLDSTKKMLPCGIVAPPVGSAAKQEQEDDKLFSLSQRFTYFQEKSVKTVSGSAQFHLRRTIRPPARYKNARMTVRLRPRQVLCSKCRSICNENSENVDLSRKPPPSPRPLFSENQNQQDSPGNKLSRLKPTEISNTLSGNKMKLVGSYWDHKDAENNKLYCLSDGDDSSERMVLRKKRSVGSMEDLWDESVFDSKEAAEDKKTRSTPVIKISFGAQGEGTVLKIPSKVHNYIPSESETDEKQQKTKDASAKAAKKALKKAKKEARRKMLSGSGASPGRSPAYEALYHRRHKHKMKHKKKHKEERKQHSKDDEMDPNGNKCWNILAPSDSYSAIKERCLKQKLSISLKRLNANAYMRCDYNGCKSPTTSSCSNSEMSDDHGETVPDFPSTHPLMMRISTQNVGSCLMGDGRRMDVGDVVWGKIHGFPWWPGKVLSITVSRKDDGASLAPQAHVAWYGSSTSSLMPCDQLCPFLETFKMRYNKKKRGPYKEAIRQATCEARRDEEQQQLQEPLLSITSSSSPCEVNVMS